MDAEYAALLGKCRDVRCDPFLLARLGELLEGLLRTRNLDVLRDLFVSLAVTRDPVIGLGERVVTYMMLEKWYDAYPVLAVYALEKLISEYGSWRDVKGLCTFLRRRSSYHPLMYSAIDMMLRALRRGDGDLVAKWVPRERQRTQWLFDLFVAQWCGGDNSSEDKRRFRHWIRRRSSPCQKNAKTPGRFATLETWLKPLRPSADAAWSRFAQEVWAGFPVESGAEVVPILVLDPAASRDWIFHLVAQTLLWVESCPACTRVVVASQPLTIICVDKMRGFAANADMLLRALKMHSVHTMNINAALRDFESSLTPVFYPIVAQSLVDVTALGMAPRYDAMRARFDQVTAV